MKVEKERQVEKRIPVHNNTAMQLYVGSSIVPPGDTRDFPESQVPAHLRPAPEPGPAPAAPENDRAALLDGNVNDVIEQFSVLTDSDLAVLIEMETEGKGRKTLLAALNDELSDRALDAAAAALLEGRDDDVLASLAEASDAELERAAEVEALGHNRENVLAAIAAEQITRKGT